MTGRRALTGLSLLCALALFAFAASSAVAATSGTTAVTCVDTSPTNNGDYVDAHCDTTGTISTSRYKHVAITTNPTTGVTGDNKETKEETKKRTPAVLEADIASTVFQIECQTVHSEGTLENILNKEEHRVVGFGVVITYSECTVPQPVGATCKWVSEKEGKKNGTITTKALLSFSIEGTPMTQKFEPAVTGGPLAEIEIKECTGVKPPVVSVTGSISATLSGQMAAAGGNGPSAGATLEVKIPRTAASTLIVAGQKAGLTQAETITKKEGNPLVTTGTPSF